MNDDFDMDMSDISDSDFDSVEVFDDVSSDLVDVEIDDFDFEDISDDSFADIDDFSVDFDVSDEFEALESNDDVEYLDLDDDFSLDDIDETFENTDILEENVGFENLDVDTSDELEDADTVSNLFENESVDIGESVIDNNSDNYSGFTIDDLPSVDEFDGEISDDVQESSIDELIDESDERYFDFIANDETEIEDIENTNDEYQTDTYEDVTSFESESNDAEFDDIDFEQSLLDEEVDNAPLTDTVYEDDSEYNEQQNELPPMTDEELGQFVDWMNQRENGNYDLIDGILNDDTLTDDQKEFMANQLYEEIKEGETQNPEYGQRVKGLTYDGRDIITSEPDEASEDIYSEISDSDWEQVLVNTETNEDSNEQQYIDDFTEVSSEEFDGELTEEDIDSVYEGLESYDFHGIDCLENTERLDSSLENFTADNWETLTIDEQKEQMENLASYIVDVTGLENPPKVEFYNNPENGDYGGFNSESNTLSINEYMLHENDEAADTVAHELWHALQHQRASNPRTKLDYMYQENFNDYIKPEDDFEGYQSQVLESEARAFAQQIKDRLHSY